MKNTTQSLIKALQSTFYGQSSQYYIENSRKLYQVAHENGFSGTIFKAIEPKLIDMVVLSKFRKEFYKYVADDEKKCSLIEKITELFNGNDIDHIYLKGSHLKDCYLESYMRSMGDIDVLVRKLDMQRAEEVLIKSGFALHSKGPVHDVFFYGDIEVELHRKLVNEKRDKGFEILSSIWENSTHLINHQYEMKPEYELVYLLYHCKKHLLTSGIGFRNVIDIGIFLDYYKSKLDVELLYSLLDQTNTSLFFCKMVGFNDRYLALTLCEHFKIEHDPDLQLYHEFTDFIITSGVHGFGREHNQFNNQFANDQNNKTSKSKSVIRLIFPSYETLRFKYPKMLKHKIFLPLAWMRRILNVIFMKTKRVFIYVTLIRKVEQAEVVKISSIFKQIGI